MGYFVIEIGIELSVFEPIGTTTILALIESEINDEFPVLTSQKDKLKGSAY